MVFCASSTNGSQLTVYLWVYCDDTFRDRKLVIQPEKQTI